MENRDELLQEEMPQTSLVESPQKPKKSRKKTIVILGAAAVVVLVAVIVLLTQGSATSVAKRYCNALFGDAARLTSLTAYDWKNQLLQFYGDEESFFEAMSDEYDTDIHSWRSFYKAESKSNQEELEDDIGKYSVEVDVTKTRKYSVDKMRTEQSDWICELEENGCFDSDEITAAKKVTVKVKIKGEDEIRRHTLDVYLVKIHGAWKVLDYETAD